MPNSHEERDLTYDVYIEGATNNTPEGVQKLAAAMSQRFGIDPSVVTTRLATGRLRVKQGASMPTARRLSQELQALGARVNMVKSDDPNRTGNTGVIALPGHGTAAHHQMPGDAAQAVTPDQTLQGQQKVVQKTMMGQGPPVPPRTPGTYASAPGRAAGAPPAAPAPPATPPELAAGTGPEASQNAGFSFGALDAGNMALEALDGTEDKKPATEDGKVGGPLTESAFAPPEDDEEIGLGGALEIERPEPPPQDPEPPMEPDAPLELGATPPSSGTVAAQPAPQTTGTMAAVAPGASGTMAAEAVDERPSKRRPVAVDGGPLARVFAGKALLRTLAGVVFALLLSFFPAQMYASNAESKYQPVVSQIREDIERLRTPSGYERLIESYSDSKKRLETISNGTRTFAIVLWLAGFALLSVLWFRFLC